MDLVATAKTIPRPGETLAGDSFARYPGGKGANQAVAAARLGAPTIMLGCLGRDAFATELKANLEDNGVAVRIVETDAPTGTAMIVVDAAGENCIVVIAGANARLDAAAIDAVPPQSGDVLVSQLEIPASAVATFFERGRTAGATTLLNAAPASPDAPPLLPLTDILIVNEIELAFLSGMPTSTRQQQIAAARACRRFPAQTIVVTLGKAGCLAVDGQAVIEQAGRPVTAVDTTGAGDCFVGALAARIRAGRPLTDSLAFANRAASICVQSPGAGPSMPTIADL